MRRSRALGLVAAGAAAATALVVTLGYGGASAQPQYPVTASIQQGLQQSKADPSAPPPGVNVPGCVPSAAHPRPVVLVTGTFGNMTSDWAGLGPTLANAGYCVYSTPIGGDPHKVVQTTGPVRDSAKQIASYVDKVLADTGADQVDLVGHSQGGLIAEYYVKALGGAPKVHTLVGLSPTTHGTTASGLAYLAGPWVGYLCPGCTDQIIGSGLIKEHNTGPIAQPGVSYTIIETHNELVVTPVGKAAFIAEPGVRNLWVQDFCASDNIGHAGLAYSHAAQKLTMNALDPANPIPAGC
jgi:pimeloyl-ACP methyl ester carboxylesterase